MQKLFWYAISAPWYVRRMVVAPFSVSVHFPSKPAVGQAAGCFSAPLTLEHSTARASSYALVGAGASSQRSWSAMKQLTDVPFSGGGFEQPIRSPVATSTAKQSARIPRWSHESGARGRASASRRGPPRSHEGHALIPTLSPWPLRARR